MKIKIIKQMRNIALLLSVFTFATIRCFGQRAISPYVGVSGEVYGFSSTFLVSNLQVGAQFALESASITTFGIYQLHGNLKTKEFSSYLFTTHLGGIGAEYRSNNSKRFALVLGLYTLTEVKTNFKNGYLKDGIPSYPRKEYGEYSYNDPPTGYHYSNDFYHSTPFAGSIWLGFDFRIIRGLNIKISLENNIIIKKIRHLNWETSDLEEQTIEEALSGQPVETMLLDRLGLRLGLRYTFSLKKEKTK